MADIVSSINWLMFALFALAYAYQIAYVALSFKKSPKRVSSKYNRRYAVVIAARNEEDVIGNLLESLHRQTYDPSLFDVYVCADGCDDATADIARSNGAVVFERPRGCAKGKGRVLDYAMRRILEKEREEGGRGYDAFIVFDADNLVAPEFVSAMDEAWDDVRFAGMTSYRNSKNIGSSWISAGYGVWFLREARWLSQARAAVGSSCLVGGTGFLVSADVIRQRGGWVWHLLTEDIEFSVDMIVSGNRIGYAKDAVLYDEQPVTFADSWRQRMRWAKGFYQVLGRYWKRLLRGAAFRRDFACYDALCTIAPAMLLTVGVIGANVFFALLALTMPAEGDAMLAAATSSLAGGVLCFLGTLFAFGAITCVSERDGIRGTFVDRLGYAVVFPFFMATYIPIAVCALFSKADWKPIRHTVAVGLDEVVPARSGVKSGNVILADGEATSASGREDV